MITPNKIEIRAVYHLPAHGKLWGWLTNANKESERYAWHTHCWCWWAEIGKTISVKKHMFNSGYLRTLEKRKIANGYEQIKADQLIELWPDFSEAIDQRMLWERLSDAD